jgi:high-affinity iron transporter
MFQSFVITLREGIEAFLIVAISLSYLKKSGKTQLIPSVKWGIVASIFISIAAGLLFQQAANQALWEGLLALIAAVLVATLTIQMWRQGRFLKKDIETHLHESSLRPPVSAFLGVFFFTVLMITREGMETALLLNTLLFQVKSSVLIIGAVLGIFGAALMAWAWSHHGHKINLGRFMQVTSVFLFLFVFQLFIYSFHELSEANIFPNSDYWHMATEPYGPDGMYGQWLTYALVVMPIGWLFISWWMDRQKKKKKFTDDQTLNDSKPLPLSR